MSATELLHTETLQLAEMQAQDLIRTPLEARFNRLARMTRRALGTRVAAISFLNAEGEWFKAVTGWNVSHLPPERSLAARLVGGGGLVAIADLEEDPKTRDHVLVTGSPRFRFCAMQPILDRFGNTIGTVAAYDTAPRKINGEVLEAISDAGDLAQRELLLSEFGGIQQRLLAKLDASRREALLDELTRLWNRRGGMLLLEQALEGDHAEGTLGVCVVDVDEFKNVNDQYGHAMGDVVLRKIAGSLVDGVRPGDIACRLGGDEFLLLIPGVDPDHLGYIMDRVKGRVQSLVVRTQAGSVKVTVSIGGTIAMGGVGESAEGVLHRADQAMYDGKRRRRGAPGEASADSGNQAGPNADF